MVKHPPGELTEPEQIPEQQSVSETQGASLGLHSAVQVPCSQVPTQQSPSVSQLSPIQSH